MTTSTVSKFQDLLDLVDEDCINSGKERLYYKVEIDGRRNTNVLARSVRRRNNTPAVSFLIRNNYQANQYSIVYLSQIDVIEVLSLMDEVMRTHLWSCLSEVYLGSFDTSYKSVKFMREAIGEEKDHVLFSLEGDAVIIPLPEKDYKVDTSFGFELSYYDFCDCMSLMLAMEPAEKLHTVLSKYYVLSELLAGRKMPVSPPLEFAHVKSVNDLRVAYDNISTKIEERERYDLNAFGYGQYDACFQK